jgi:hypothetical protein
MDGACSTYGEKEKCMYDFGGETRRKENIRRSMEDNIKIGINAAV